MRACHVLRNSSALTTTARLSSFLLPNTIPNRSRNSPGRPLVSAAVTEPEALRPAEQETPRKPAFVLLQNAISILPRALSTANDAVGPESSHFWNNILEGSVTELSSGSDQVPSKATIAVCGFDKWAGSHDLVTALLEDPFTSDHTYSEILRNRWKDAPSCVNIEYGKPAAFSGELSSPSDWLQRFPHAIQLTELPDLSSLSSVSDETDSLLLDCDVLLLLCDPIVTPLSDLAARARHLLNKPNTILLLTSGSASDTHRLFVSRTLSDIGCRPGCILFVEPRQALDAVTALQADPTSPSTIDRYQRDTLGSRISTITVAINETFRPKNLSKTSLLDLRQETALLQVHGSLSASFRSVQATRESVDDIASNVDNLLSKVETIREDAQHDIFGESGDGNKIEKALSTGANEMNTLLGSLTFWRMVWRVDELGSLVSAAVHGKWCRELENQLILQTGRLECVRSELSNSAFSLLSATSSTSLRSFVLENQLQQLNYSPTRVLGTSSLLQPIHDRRSQLIQYTTSKLHREAQSAVAGAFGGVLGGAGLGWWLAFGEHILSLGAGTEMGTAIGSGALLAMGSIRWAVGKWERAKRRWTQDSVRIGEGLTRDLQRTVQQTVDENVTIVASTACKGMQDLIDRRRNEIHELHEELCGLDAELQACAQFPTSRTPHNPRR